LPFFQVASGKTVRGLGAKSDIAERFCEAKTPFNELQTLADIPFDNMANAEIVERHHLWSG
jgi:hypothetical protein